MDDLIVLAFIVLVYMVSASVRKKMKAQKQAAGANANPSAQRQKAKRAKQTNFAAAFGDMADSAGKMSPGMAGAAIPAGEGDPRRAHGPGIHLHEVSDAQMDVAMEGEDPCHAGYAQTGLGETEAPANPGREELARELLRGVIMSEILTRPCQRQAAMRRRTKA